MTTGDDTPPSGRAQTALWELVRGAVAQARRDKGATQSLIARRLGVPRGLVCYWLARPERMTLKAATRLLAAVDAELEFRLAPDRRRWSETP